MACACGCGGTPNKGRQFVNGHQRRGRPHTAATRARLSASFSGRAYQPRQCLSCADEFVPLTPRHTTCGVVCKRQRQASVLKAWKQTESGQKSIVALQAARRAIYAANPGQARDDALKSNYGITRAEWGALLGKQEGMCAICSKVLDRGKKTHVDHDHGSGKVRGLLCGHCNVAIGMLNEKPALMHAAADYIQLHA